MEFMLVITLVAVAGGVLGYFAGKKYKPGKTRKINSGLLFVVLVLSLYAALTVSKVYLVCVVLIAGELIGMAVPSKSE